MCVLNTRGGGGGGGRGVLFIVGYTEKFHLKLGRNFKFTSTLAEKILEVSPIRLSTNSFLSGMMAEAFISSYRMMGVFMREKQRNLKVDMIKLNKVTLNYFSM